MSTKTTRCCALFRNWRQAIRGLLLILVPRKPERFDEAEAKLRGAGLRVHSPVARDHPGGYGAARA